MKIAEILSEVVSARPFPTRTFRRVYHVGSLDISQKRQGSLEGAGLSISVNPDEWRRIGRGAVSGELWEGTRAGNRFLDSHRMNRAHRQMIADWAIQAGYAASASVWRVTWVDDELGGNVHQDFTDPEQARIEAEDYEVEPQEIKGSLHATDKLRQRTMHTAEPVMVPDLIATVYVEDATDLDGVWWQDRLDVSAYSAPRGVIAPKMLSLWTFRRVG